MSKLPNIIQKRELDPLLIKAGKIAEYYEKAANCKASVFGPDGNICVNNFNSICKHCKHCDENNTQTMGKLACFLMHTQAINEARNLGGAYIYLCSEGVVFWTSPFYAGERYAGAFLSGGVQGTLKNNDRVKALANMMLVCADKISGLSFVQKNITMHIPAITEHTGEDRQNKKDENNAFLLDMERMILANLRRGDTGEAQTILDKLLHSYYQGLKDNFPAFRLKALELTVLLSRAAFDPNEIKDNTILDFNSRYLKKIEESSSYEEIKEVLNSITEKMSGKIFSFHGVQHFAALGKAERYIWQNYTRKLSLKEIAEISGLSAPYFSTIFKEEMGENLSNYLNRLRVEKAATMLVTTNIPISEIAVSCGFEDQSWFSKIFKNNTGFTPGKYRSQGSIL
uniref:Two-component response regulator yesN n=1 Tax=uncultured bacterium contig00064 TaxID=1181547 RepID=A0A806K0B1_9BACT|nr:two-component response regulator yesN [uncultured bacterium contig00064]